MIRTDGKYDRHDPPTREVQRNVRRDKKLSRGNAPVLHGLPRGFPAGYWMQRQSKEGGKTK